MGFGLPAAIGAKVARPDALVIDVDGDASFSMTLTELSTMAQFNIGAKVIILNNVSVVQGISFGPADATLTLNSAIGGAR